MTPAPLSCGSRVTLSRCQMEPRPNRGRLTDRWMRSSLVAAAMSSHNGGRRWSEDETQKADLCGARGWCTGVRNGTTVKGGQGTLDEHDRGRIDGRGLPRDRGG